MEIPKPKAGFLIQFWSALSCLPKRKKSNSTNVLLLKISVLSIVCCRNSWEKVMLSCRCLARKLIALFAKNIEAVLVSLPPTNGLELNDSHITTLENFQFFLLSAFQLLLLKISNSTAPTDVNTIEDL